MILGTAALGAEYGIHNETGEPDREHCYELLDYAWKEGKKHIDTAPVYGKSEEIIGDYVKLASRKFIVDTKYISCNPNAGELVESIQESYKKLHCEINILYLRSIDQYMNKEIMDKLQELKERKEIRNIGLSIYEPYELEYIVNHTKNIDCVQIPFNLFSVSKWSRSGLLKKAKQTGILIYARSIYLQGLFFCNPMDEKIVRLNASNCVKKIHKLAEWAGYTIQDFAYTFVKSMGEIDDVIIGFETLDQLKEDIILENKNVVLKKTVIEKVVELSETISDRILDPRMW